MTPPKRPPPPLPAAARRPQGASHADDDRPRRPRPARLPPRPAGQGLMIAGAAVGLFLLLACILTGLGYILWPKPGTQPKPVASATPPAAVAPPAAAPPNGAPALA